MLERRHDDVAKTMEDEDLKTQMRLSKLEFRKKLPLGDLQNSKEFFSAKGFEKKD